jgi:hypothetical protein
MRRELAFLTALSVALAAVVLVATVGSAEDGSPSAQSVIPNLTGGGGSTWAFNDTNSAACGLVGAGLNVVDAVRPSTAFDAYDGAFYGYVDGTVVPGPPASTGATFVEAGPVTMSGVQVNVRYDAIPGSAAVLREVVTFTNPDATNVNLTWTQYYNVGSDSQTTLLATGDGDTTLEAADSYSVSWDGVVSPGNDPVNTLVEFGDGPVLHPTFNAGCPNTFAGSDRLALDYAVTVPAGGTVRLMFFGVLDENADTPRAAAVAAAPSYPAMTASSPLLAGLTAEQLATILNWNFPLPQAVAPTIVANFTG